MHEDRGIEGDVQSDGRVARVGGGLDLHSNPHTVKAGLSVLDAVFRRGLFI